jgi:hypothetical protein
MRDESRNPRLKTEVLFCLRKSWKAEGKKLRAFGPPVVPSVFGLQPST